VQVVAAGRLRLAHSAFQLVHQVAMFFEEPQLAHRGDDAERNPVECERHRCNQAHGQRAFLVFMLRAEPTLPIVALVTVGARVGARTYP